MSGARRGRIAAVAAACLLLAAAVQAETPAYKCVGKRGVTYSQTPCPGGREVGATQARTTDKWKSPPQDRAVRVRRARLSEEDRQECAALDVRLKEQAAQVKAKGDAATLQDEMPLVRSKKRFRELRC